ncbi:MAG: ribosome-associated translation inhibitor RaiA [Clostridia bacterium]|nr:ribosome-associated translation inhibitor RaiA [Clostridia bacterium]
MKLNITGKGVAINQQITDAVEKRVEKLAKFFTDDIKVNVFVRPERAKIKMETTISTKGVVFRAEDVSQDIFDCIDIVFDKLTNQMTKHKGKMQNKYGKDSIRFEMIPEVKDDEPESKIVKSEKMTLSPVSPDGASLQMELLGHTFFVFLNEDTNEINVVYKRNDSDYGLLETVK